MGGACVQGSSLAGSTKRRFTRSGAAQAKANRIDVLFELQHGPMMRVEAPHPGVIDPRVAEFLKPRVGAPRAPFLVHPEQALMEAGLRTWIFKRLRAKECSSSPSPSSGVMPRGVPQKRRGKYGVGHPTNSDMRSGGQRKRAEILTLCAAQLRVAPKEARRSDENLSIINKPFVLKALGLERVGDVLAHLRVTRVPQNQRTLDCAKHVALFGGSVGGKRGDGEGEG